MPRIFDNIDLRLLPILPDTLNVSYKTNFCVGYFNLRGWQKIDDLIEQYIGEENACCRLLKILLIKVRIYEVEKPANLIVKISRFRDFINRSGGIRTHDLHYPKVARYQAALRPGQNYHIIAKLYDNQGVSSKNFEHSRSLQ